MKNKLGSYLYMPNDWREEKPYTIIKCYSIDKDRVIINTRTKEQSQINRFIACNEDDCKIFTVSDSGVFEVNNIKIK